MNSSAVLYKCAMKLPKSTQDFGTMSSVGYSTCEDFAHQFEMKLNGEKSNAGIKTDSIVISAFNFIPVCVCACMRGIETAC